MVKRFLILSFLLLLIIPLVLSQEIDKDNKLRNLVGEFRQAEVTIPYPGTKAIETLTRNVSITSIKDKKVYISISTLTIDWFLAQKFDYLILERPDYKGMKSAATLGQAMEWQSYPTYLQYDSIMQYFASTYPALCHLDTIGTSIDGRLVLAIKISDNAAITEGKPEVFYTSTIHGDETGGFILMLHLADYLLKNYSIDARVKNLVDNLEIWINPLANPDGTYTSGNTITFPTRGNANNFDLNRNFPDPVSTTSPMQKETSDMVKFMRNHKFVLSANFHSGAEVVNYPWDRWARLHADNDWFIDICRNYTDTVHKYSVPGYMTYLNNGITNGYEWYSINGGRQDFVTYELGGREVTVELDDQYITPAADLILLWQYNRQSLLGYIENAMYGIHGMVRDIHTLVPLAAKVYISGHDKDSSQVYSDTLRGRFTRFLSPGTWSLTFSSKGYQDTIVGNVIVIEGQSTDLTVGMRSITTTIDTTERESPLLYPNPASTYIWAKLPENLSGKVNIKVINESGMKVADYNKDFLFGFPLFIDVKGLAGGGYTIIFTNIQTGVSYRSRVIITGRTF
jgi:hypothetical protein